MKKIGKRPEIGRVLALNLRPPQRHSNPRNHMEKACKNTAYAVPKTRTFYACKDLWKQFSKSDGVSWPSNKILFFKKLLLLSMMIALVTCLPKYPFDLVDDDSAAVALGPIAYRLCVDSLLCRATHAGSLLFHTRFPQVFWALPNTQSILTFLTFHFWEF